jgi:hypothetical protein
MSTIPPLTPEQLKALQTVKEFAELLLPYRMYLDPRNPAGAQNLVLLSAELRKNGLSETAENLYSVTNKIVLENKIQWIEGCEPPKLKAQKLNESNVIELPDATKEAEARRLRKLAQEAADKKKAEDVKTFERIDGAISALRLHFVSDTNDNQTRLRGYVGKQKARNADPESIFTQVKKDIARLYSDEEKSRMYL